MKKLFKKSEIKAMNLDEEERFNVEGWDVETMAWLFNPYCNTRGTEFGKFLAWTVRGFLGKASQGSLNAYCEYMASRFGVSETNVRKALKGEEFNNSHIFASDLFGLDTLEYTL